MDTEESIESNPNPELVQRTLREFNDKVASCFGGLIDKGNTKEFAIVTDDGPKTVQIVWMKSDDSARVAIIDSDTPISKPDGKTVYTYKAIISKHTPNFNSPLQLDYHVGEMKRNEAFKIYEDPFIASYDTKKRQEGVAFRKKMFGEASDLEQLHNFMDIIDQIQKPIAKVGRWMGRSTRITPPVRTKN